MRKYLFLFVCMICLFSMGANAQQERKNIRKGNDLFKENSFEKSEVEYRRALDKKINSYEAGFNLGDALYKQKKYDEALKQFQSLAVTEKDPNKLSQLYHNIGNTLLMNKKVDESIEAYKQSLRLKPDSPETKYNLEYARWMKQKQQKQKNKNKDQNKDQKNKDQKKDQNKQNQDKKDQKDQKKKDPQKKDQQKKDQQNKSGSKDQKKKEKQQGQENKISKKDAKRLLKALQNDEKKVQEKVQKARAKAQKAKKVKIKKDW